LSNPCGSIGIAKPIEGIGKMLKTETKCSWCNGFTRGDTCAKSLTCPTCDAKPGQECKRPSGHKAAALHKARVQKGYAIDDANNFDWQNVYADLIKVTR
jgi:hypothetical protein